MRRFATCVFAAAMLLVLFSSLSLATLRRPVSSPAEAELALDNLKKRYAEATSETDWKLLAAKGEALMARYGDLGIPIRKPDKTRQMGLMLPRRVSDGRKLSALIAGFISMQVSGTNWPILEQGSNGQLTSHGSSRSISGQRQRPIFSSTML